MTINIPELKALAEKASPGEWSLGEGDQFVVVEGVVDVCGCTDQDDAAYIVAVQPAAILELIERLQTDTAEAYERGKRDALAWQPIETAPKDGTVIQAVISGDWEPRCRFNTKRNVWEAIGLDSFDCMEWLSSAAPTHWMPMPTLLKEGK